MFVQILRPKWTEGEVFRSPQGEKFSCQSATRTIASRGKEPFIPAKSTGKTEAHSSTKARRRSRTGSLRNLADGRAIHNALLLGLPDKERDYLYSHLVFKELATHEILNEMDTAIEHVYFMNSGLASVLNVMRDGKSVEVGLTGKEGFVGLPLLGGFRSSPARVIVQVRGSAFRLSSGEFLNALRKCGALERRLQGYGQILGIQAAQVAACNRLHEVDERLARWLLMSQDRLDSEVVGLTQEFLAHMLGTRRSSVTVAASILQKAGLIKYSRGNVKIVDRVGLEGAACECYRALVERAARWVRESAEGKG